MTPLTNRIQEKKEANTFFLSFDRPLADYWTDILLLVVSCPLPPLPTPSMCKQAY